MYIYTFPGSGSPPAMVKVIAPSPFFFVFLLRLLDAFIGKKVRVFKSYNQPNLSKETSQWQFQESTEALGGRVSTQALNR